MIKKYEKYKRVKSSFFYEIPVEWARYKIKNIVDNNKYYPVGDGDHGAIKPEMYLDEGIPYIRVQNLTWHGEITNDGMVYIDREVQDANKKSILFPGDILIAKTGATIGKLGLIPESIIEANTTSSVGKVTIDKSRFHPKYILYCFQSANFNDQIWLEASQKSAQPGFNIDDLIVLEILAPTLFEQSIIAGFLDYQTDIIDEIIQRKERLIELLKEKRQSIINEVVTKGLNPNAKMKNSGIEWIGDLPEHWGFKCLKYLVNGNRGIQTGPFGTQLNTKDYTDSGVKVLNQKTLIDEDYDSGEEFISPEKMKKLNGFEVIGGDIILGTRGSFGTKNRTTFGKCSMVPETIPESVLHPCLIRIRLNEKRLLKKYFKLYVNDSSHFLEEILNTSNSTTIEVIYGITLKNVKFPVPPISEQIEIVMYLEQKANDIDNIILQESIQITKLKEYRQSLISEAVTGKIDVRDWQPKNKTA